MIRVYTRFHMPSSNISVSYRHQTEIYIQTACSPPFYILHKYYPNVAYFSKFYYDTQFQGLKCSANNLPPPRRKVHARIRNLISRKKLEHGNRLVYR
jgi:hypothetical protein